MPQRTLTSTIWQTERCRTEIHRETERFGNHLREPAEGRGRSAFRPSRGRDTAVLRRAVVIPAVAACVGTARAIGGARGGRLCQDDGQTGRVRGDIWPGSDQPGDGDNGSQGGQRAAGGHNGPGGASRVGHRGIPRVRYLQHRIGMHEAHVSGDVRRRPRPDDTGGFSRGPGRAAGARVDRRASGRSVGRSRVRIPGNAYGCRKRRCRTKRWRTSARRPNSSTRRSAQ